MILGAGLGTRLSPLTDELPKPLVPIGDRPMLAHLAERLAEAGFSSFVLNVHHLTGEFSKIDEYIRSRVHLVEEPEIRGTAGGIAGARGLFEKAPILVWNGDVLAEPPVAALLDAAESSGLAFCISPREVSSGTVGLDASGAVVRLRGESFGVEASGGDYIGVAAIGENVLRALPERGCLIADVALPMLRKGATIATCATARPWIDIGSVARYHEANLNWLERYRAIEGRPGATERAWVSPSASVGPGVSLSRAIVGAGARVEGTGLVERSVVWPGARAQAPLRDVVVARSGRVVAVA
jgi:mannose-1-phosphate guanylyltransferase